jgi:hypothetical protein
VGYYFLSKVQTGTVVAAGWLAGARGARLELMRWVVVVVTTAAVSFTRSHDHATSRSILIPTVTDVSTPI